MGRSSAKTGSKGPGEAQFVHPFGIATMPSDIASACLFATLFSSSNLSDCEHGPVVSEIGPPPNRRVQFLAASADRDSDGITDEIDLRAAADSMDFSNASLGFATSGSILNAGDQIFAIYNTLSPAPADEIRSGRRRIAVSYP